MKITSFDPYILVKDAESAVQLFQALGFEKRHRQEGIGVTAAHRRDGLQRQSEDR